MAVNIVLAYDSVDEVCGLFSEYTDMLINGDPEFREYLEIQNYDEELNHLETKYGLPDGRLYLAYCEGRAAGCIGLKKLDSLNCEMKRLYVRPEFRGKHIGGMLIQRIIDDAKEIGYKHMLLDTLPFLENAVHMYKKRGFYEIPCYNDSPMESSIYMRLDLDGSTTDGERAGAVEKVHVHIVNLTNFPRLSGPAAEWFHEKWTIPLEEYKSSIEASINGENPVPQWYVAVKGERIIGGLGVIENDFHRRKDLTPNVCALYVEEECRGQGIAGKLLDHVCGDMLEKGIDTLYLITDHTSFYERYGWEFLCQVEEEAGGLCRMYVHRENGRK